MRAHPGQRAVPAGRAVVDAMGEPLQMIERVLEYYFVDSLPEGSLAAGDQASWASSQRSGLRHSRERSSSRS